MFLLLIILAILGLLTAIFADYRRILSKPEKIISLIEEGTSISAGRIRQTATRNGVTEWSLESVSAKYLNEKKQAVFQDLSVTFFLKDSRKVYLTANEGILKTDSNDIEVTGNVVVKNEDYNLKTEKLYYEHEKRIFSSKSPVEIIGSAFDLAADAMFFDLNTNRTVFQGNVKGAFQQNVAL
jgi:LPS export ABC transporter protein LptC